LGWLKMKRALATLDCVVVGVEMGHGKRHGVLSDYTFAVRDEAADRFVTIGKAYTGLADAEIAEMTRWFEAHTVRHFGRFREVEPLVVIEVAFDVIQRSNRHQSGFALRFPRIVHLRTDKQPAEIDTLATVERLHRELQHEAEYLVTAGARRPEKRPV
jgi:DNA ligase-1